MKTMSHANPSSGGETYKPRHVPEVEVIKAKGDYLIRVTSLWIALLLVTGGIVFSLCYPSHLPAIWSVITPIILTILALALRNNRRGSTAPK